jgi:hypothetical protein
MNRERAVSTPTHPTQCSVPGCDEEAYALDDYGRCWSCRGGESGNGNGATRTTEADEDHALGAWVSNS